jgi:phosphatidate cytidylyltransferase
VITLKRHDPGAGADVAAENGDARNFTRRIVSALVLAPIAILVAYFGGWLFLCVCAIAAGIILWEWSGLLAAGGDLRVLAPGLITLAIAALLTGAGAPGGAFGVIAFGALLAGMFVAVWPRHYPASNSPAWGAAGVVYAGVALVPPAALRADAEFGFAALLFLFAIVWATDVLAYLTGRALGGPLLWPQLSPKKTWAGAIGGLVGGVVAGIPVAYASVGTGSVAAGVLAVVLSIVAQSGDLFESAVKRRFGAKDAGSLIPGHGGVMDRLDGFVAAALVALLIGSVHQSMAGAARGLLVW